MPRTNRLLDEYRLLLRDPRFIWSCIFGILMIGLSLVANYYASVYATDRASNPVNDLILSNIPVFDVDGIFVFGPFVLWAFVAVLCLLQPKRIPFVAKSIALLVLIRAGFVTLTHIGPFPYEVPINYSSNWVWWFSQGGDLFFSDHTALPFLMALIFGARDNRFFWLFTCIAAFFGTVVLLGHLHYSIDVASAFFITYAVYHICLRWFPRDAKRFYENSALAAPVQ